MSLISHRIKYEGLDIEVFGSYEKSEESTGYKGGWATELIKVNDVDIYWMLKTEVVEQINLVVVTDNY